MSNTCDIKLYSGDCLELMKDIPDKSVDLVLCDLPYGNTACSLDTIIPFDKLWEQYERIITDIGKVLLFGSEPFSSFLRTSNIKLYKYDWIWGKGRGSGFAKNKPLKCHENISVFSKGTTVHKTQSKKRMTYNPQMVKADKVYKRGMVIRDKENDIQQSDNYGEQKSFYRLMKV